MKIALAVALVVLATIAFVPAASAQPAPESCGLQSGPDGTRALHCTGLVPLCIFIVRGPQAIECTP